MRRAPSDHCGARLDRSELRDRTDRSVDNDGFEPGFTSPHDVDEPQRGSLIVWEDSARDGSQINVREYPVWLTPADS